MGYIDNVTSSIVNKKITFSDANKSAASAEISVVLRVSGVERDVTAYLTPSSVKSSDRFKFAFSLAVPQGVAGRAIVEGLEAAIFKINSTYPLVPLGSHCVGYWLPGEVGKAIQAFKYDFTDISQAFTIPTPGKIREYVDGKWTGNFIDGTINKPLSSTIDIKGNNATITFDLKGLTFTPGQVINFDPVAMTGSVNREDGEIYGTHDITVAVPADAEFLVMAFAGYVGYDFPFTGGTLTYDFGGANTVMTEVSGGDGSYATAFQGMMAYVLIPSGDRGNNKTVRHAWFDVLFNSDLHSWAFYKGIDTASPVRDTDGGQNASVSNISLTMTTVSGDLVVAAVCGYAGAEGSVTTWTGITTDYELAKYDFSDITWGVATATDVSLVVSPDTVVNYEDGAFLAIVLKPAAAGGGLDQSTRMVALGG